MEIDKDINVSNSIKLSNSSVVFSGEKKTVTLNFDLNVPADRGFDLNKFPDEGDEAFA